MAKRLHPTALTGSGEGEDSLRDHMGNKQDYFTATKTFTQNPANAEHVETLSDDNATLEQKQKAYDALANTIAAQMGISPVDAKAYIDQDAQFAGLYSKRNRHHLC